MLLTCVHELYAWPMMMDELTVSEARKELREIGRMRGNLKTTKEATTRINALAARILRRVSIYGDTQTRALMAVYAELSKP
jgi:hypothetical protein